MKNPQNSQYTPLHSNLLAEIFQRGLRDSREQFDRGRFYKPFTLEGFVYGLGCTPEAYRGELTAGQAVATAEYLLAWGTTVTPEGVECVDLDDFFIRLPPTWSDEVRAQLFYCRNPQVCPELKFSGFDLHVPAPMLKNLLWPGRDLLKAHPVLFTGKLLWLHSVGHVVGPDDRTRLGFSYSGTSVLRLLDAPPSRTPDITFLV
ncbi:hypothetical protein [Deinococcus misasensis]|uniref:hypothetical protein n=1 Tax=Deinococcus misasensis TaxID=392413 RepID=UPI000557857D|nr:hypothetical protein [Deinococcus misasensis]